MDVREAYSEGKTERLYNPPEAKYGFTGRGHYKVGIVRSKQFVADKQRNHGDYDVDGTGHL